MSNSRRGFTLIELAASVGAAGLLVSGAALVTQPRDDARKLKDSTQIRGIQQGLVVWAQNNEDSYPLPSAIDKNNDTVKEQGRAKDTTANIYSTMVYIGALSPEIFISPVEKNPSIVLDEDYQYDAPKAASKPSMALWDPAFSADFTGGKKGNVSYAHLQPAGARLQRWNNTATKDDIILATRGPEVRSSEPRSDGSVKVTLANPQSVTLTLHGDGSAWSGWTTSNDVGVAFHTADIGQGMPRGPASRTYTNKSGKVLPDVWFFDEPDDPRSTNTYLGIFTKAGATPKDYKAIWD
jgi:hypothetical protein